MLRSQFTGFSDRQSPFTVNKTMQSQFTVNCLFTDHEKLKMSITNHKELKMPITCHENKYIYPTNLREHKWSKWSIHFICRFGNIKLYKHERCAISCNINMWSHQRNIVRKKALFYFLVFIYNYTWSFAYSLISRAATHTHTHSSILRILEVLACFHEHMSLSCHILNT